MFNLVEKLKKPYKDNCADFTNSNGKRIYDNEIADFVIKHFKIWDWLNPYKVTCGVQWAFICLHDQMLHGTDPEKTWKEMF